MTPIHQWVNAHPKSFSRLAVNAVLRSNITNAIAYLDKVPAFADEGALAAFRAGFNRDWTTPKFATPGFYISQRKYCPHCLKQHFHTRRCWQSMLGYFQNA